MAAVAGRRRLGLFDSGRAQDPTDSNWTNAYTYYTADKLSGDGCWGMLGTNIYGSTALCGEFIPVDPENKYYVMSLAVKTITQNYLGNNGSGHLGFAGYDADKNFISHHQAFSTDNTTLSRAASPGDTTIYIANATTNMQNNMNSGTSHRRSLNFYFSGSPYPTVGGYTRYNMYANVVQNSITQTAQGDWEITFSSGLPNWGYTFAVGTPVGRTYAGGSYNYALGAPVYPTDWTTYSTGVMHGYVSGGPSSGASFRDQTKFIRFLNLRNYNYRTQRDGNSANYLLDNIHWLEVPGNAKATRISGNTRLRERSRRIR